MKVGDLVTIICKYPSGTHHNVKGYVGIITDVGLSNNYLVRLVNGNVWAFSSDEIRPATDKEIRSALRDALERW